MAFKVDIELIFLWSKPSSSWIFRTFITSLTRLMWRVCAAIQACLRLLLWHVLQLLWELVIRESSAGIVRSSVCVGEIQEHPGENVCACVELWIFCKCTYRFVWVSKFKSSHCWCVIPDCFCWEQKKSRCSRRLPPLSWIKRPRWRAAVKARGGKNKTVQLHLFGFLTADHFPCIF